MKIRNYERKTGILLGMIFLWIIEAIFCLYVWMKKDYTYEILTGTMIKKDLVLFIVSKEDRKLLYQNQLLFFQSKKQKYTIEEDRGVVLKKNKKTYYEMVLSIKTPKNCKAMDGLSYSLPKEKKRIFRLLKEIGEGD